MKLLLQYYFLGLVFVESVDKRYRILGIFPHTAKSHDYVFSPLMRGLAEKGHHVTVISHFPIKNPPKTYQHINLRGSSPILEDALTFDKLKRPTSFFGAEHILKHLDNIWMFSEMSNATCLPMLQNKEVRALKTGQFDLAIYETFNSDCSLGIIDQLNVPYIGFSSHALMPWTTRRLGITENPSFKPTHFLGYGRYPNYFQRIISFITNEIYIILYHELLQKNDMKTLSSHYKKECFHLEDLAENTGLVLLSTYYPFHGTFEYPPNVVEIGGLHITNSEPLPQDLQFYMDSAKNGVIVFSMGSMIKATSWPIEKLTAFKKAFSELPYNILWKWEDETMNGMPPNVKLVKWLPQFDILNHANVKAFITHAGGLGLSEAVFCGVPVLAIPIFGDQAFNAAAAKDSNIGEVLNYEDITADNVLVSLRKVLHPETKKTAMKLSAIFKDRQNSPLETGIYWVEHFIRHGGKHLRPVSADIPLHRYLLLDILALAAVITLISMALIALLLKRIKKLQCTLDHCEKILTDEKLKKTATDKEKLH